MRALDAFPVDFEYLVAAMPQIEADIRLLNAWCCVWVQGNAVIGWAVRAPVVARYKERAAVIEFAMIHHVTGIEQIIVLRRSCHEAAGSRTEKFVSPVFSANLAGKIDGGFLYCDRNKRGTHGNIILPIWVKVALGQKGRYVVSVQDWRDRAPPDRSGLIG